MKRIYSLDISRIIAICLVVLTHASANVGISADASSTSFLIGNIFNSISRSGVPIFLMISGALLLDENREKSMKDMLMASKNIFILLITWSFLYAIVFDVALPFLLEEKIVFSNFLNTTVFGYYHSWYLYVLIGLYLATPFLKLFVKKENSKLILWFLLFSFIAQSLPFVIESLQYLHIDLSLLGNYINKYDMKFFSGHTFFFIIGWYIIHIGIHQKWLKNLIYILSIVSLIGMISFVYFTKSSVPIYNNSNLLVILYSLGIFLFINNANFNREKRNTTIITKLSNLTFGVYIIHPFIDSAVKKIIPVLIPNISSLPYILLRFSTVLTISFLCSYMLSKIPYLKKLIRA